MTSKELKRIKARYEAATAGQWHENFSVATGSEIVGPDSNICSVYEGHTEQGYANMLFIAHAHNDLRDCLDEIERMRGNVQAILDECQTNSDEQDTIYFVEECKLYEILEGD